MNKDEFQAIYNKPRKPLDFLNDFCKNYDDFMTMEAIKPEFTNPRPVSVKSKNVSKEDSSIVNTLSICSNLSRIGMDKLVIENILRNRKEHPIFSEIEPTEDAKSKIWYMMDDKDDKIIGPFTNSEMDQRFELMILKVTTKIKKKFEEEYYPLMVLLKRYYKNVLSERIETDKKETGKLSNKVIKFHKGELIKSHLKMKEKFDPKQREERFFSHAVKPKMVDLNNMLPKDDGDDESDCYSRLRTNTFTQRN